MSYVAANVQASGNTMDGTSWPLCSLITCVEEEIKENIFLGFIFIKLVVINMSIFSVNFYTKMSQNIGRDLFPFLRIFPLIFPLCLLLMMQLAPSQASSSRKKPSVAESLNFQFWILIEREIWKETFGKYLELMKVQLNCKCYRKNTRKVLTKQEMWKRTTKKVSL